MATGIVEMRTYTLHPGKVPLYLEHYEKEGLEVQRRILGNLVGYYSSEIGTVNQIVHMWGYADLAERQRRRAELAAAPTWKAYLPKILPLIQLMENKILIPTAFSPR